LIELFVTFVRREWLAPSFDDAGIGSSSWAGEHASRDIFDKVVPPGMELQGGRAPLRGSLRRISVREYLLRAVTCLLFPVFTRGCYDYNFYNIGVLNS
jgi:hypothetical protein